MKIIDLHNLLRISIIRIMDSHNRIMDIPFVTP